MMNKTKSNTFSERVMKFYDALHIEEVLPEGIEIINPYQQAEVKEVCREFYTKYYSDNNGRHLILGINPGRFGAGITGIPFTDPQKLADECGIANSFNKRSELSSEFIYFLINAMGGPAHFYKHYFIGAVSPLGFLKNGKNHNYYDSAELYRALKPFIIKNLVEQIGLGITSRKCFCLGQGKNLEYMNRLNDELGLFDEIIPLPHPRWVMQYRRKKLDLYLSDSAKILSLG
ncbi:MAG: DUF4918 domain-containing protein [Bacteroidetes bacterium]|nr:MAG: DUF4918 domain-containing protein [Bacteroidota bacterium]